MKLNKNNPPKVKAVSENKTTIKAIRIEVMQKKRWYYRKRERGIIWYL